MTSRGSSGSRRTSSTRGQGAGASKSGASRAGSAKKGGSGARGVAGTGKSGGQGRPRQKAKPPITTIQQILRVGFIPGVEPDRFMRRWKTAPRTAWLELHPLALSEQLSALAEGRVDMCFVRLPLAEGADAEGTDAKGADAEGSGAPAALTAADLHIVPLWEEQPVALMGDEHLLSLHEEILLADLEGETEILPRHLDDAEERVEVAATGAGFTRLPLSLARLHHRKDAVHRVITDAEPTQIAIVWPRAADDDARQEFVGTVRGRTGRSGRNGG